MTTVQKPLKVGKTDSYSLTVSSEWLGSETIVSATVTTDNSYVTSGAVTIVDNIIYVFLTGVLATNRTEIHFDYSTATRTDCDSFNVVVKDC